MSVPSAASLALMSGAAAATGCGCIVGLKMYVDNLLNVQLDAQREAQRERGERRRSSTSRRTRASFIEEEDSDGDEERGHSARKGYNHNNHEYHDHSDRSGTKEPMEAGWQGFSMEEARKLADANQVLAASMSPKEVLATLQKGNMRFWTGAAHRPEKSAFERRALISKQFPVAAVLSCSDSRVPTEIVFDMGLGDIFVIRVAGNCLDTAPLASLQYAVKHLKVKVVVIMGHEGCGAVKAAGLDPAAINNEPQALGSLLRGLKGGLEHGRLANITDSRAYDREAVVTNVKRQIEMLAGDDLIMDKVIKEELICLGAFYEISSGIVDFFSELTVKSRDNESPTSPSFRRGVSGQLAVRLPEDKRLSLRGPHLL